jgi:hypothetical protein
MQHLHSPFFRSSGRMRAHAADAGSSSRRHFIICLDHLEASSALPPAPMTFEIAAFAVAISLQLVLVSSACNCRNEISTRLLLFLSAEAQIFYLGDAVLSDWCRGPWPCVSPLGARRATGTQTNSATLLARRYSWFRTRVCSKMMPLGLSFVMTTIVLALVPKQDEHYEAAAEPQTHDVLLINSS